MSLQDVCAAAVIDSRKQETGPLEWGGWALYRDERKLMPTGIRLSPQQCDVVAVFLGARGGAMHPGPMAYGLGISDGQLRQVIKNIRRLIGADSIRNRRNLGYWMAKVPEEGGSPVEELIDALEKALAAAKKLRVEKD